MKYTEEEYAEFKHLVELGESHAQMDRIHARLDMPKFIEKVGKEKCEVMYAALCCE